ncbi:homocysteine S-methyltransferase family protein [Anaerolentibacter hominis]|uniref:homocysteine S-methyltransferase family protein n=1 Tax=Anaerolentibacter hominis TaxID=3079009 RepID=UPI0031B86CE9
MTKEQFKALCQEGILVLDGATGSNLQKRGMPAGVCPELWILEHADIMKGLQREYIQAGARILYTPTFSGNRIKLKEYGLEAYVREMNRELVKLTREVAAQSNQNIYVAADMTMTGEQLYPIGTLTFEELVDVYKEQVSCMLEEGVDLFVVETMMSLNECRAALLAIKETCDLPVMVTLTFKEDGTTFYGTYPETAVIVLQSMGADAVGVNCSTGPDKMYSIVKRMKEYAAVPIIAKPNAGIPALIDGETVYNMGPEEFAEETAKLVEAGASVLGGCCGTTPLHIALLYMKVKEMKSPEIRTEQPRVLTTERKFVPIELDGRFKIVGERINPTGKKALQAELREGSLELVRQMAEDQAEQGAQILDINMGMNGIDEKEMMLKTIYELINLVDTPLSIDSSYVDIIEAALRIYPGRALINSISMETEKMEKLLPIAKKYGAMFILLPLSDKGLPADLEEKKDIIRGVVKRAEELGLTKNDIIVDGLVQTVGANKAAALETIDTIRYCKEELGLATICGLSNISFGLPERQFVNSTFLTLAIGAGLTMAISNPSQELLVRTAFAADLLMAKEDADLRYMDRVSNNPMTMGTSSGTGAVAGAGTKKQDGLSEKPVIFQMVVKGNRKQILEGVKAELSRGTAPSDILDNMLIPAINEVGRLFDKQIYFLPQLISGAETMRMAVDYLEPLLVQSGTDKKQGKIVLASVAGDIHDIGKNLVGLMLKNYGFEVIDLGKDVPAERIVDTALREDADIIGLSALMTTTMMEMKNVIELAKEKQARAKVIIGGAVITESFAREIGADGYSPDASEAVVLARKLLNLGNTNE